MAQIQIVMPQLGESIAEATVMNFLVNVGDEVQSGQDLLEVETNKAVMTVKSPCKGKLAKWLVTTNESYPVGAILGYLDTEEAQTKPHEIDTVETKKTPECPNSHALPQQQSVSPTVRGLPVPAQVLGASYMSPRLKARMHELGLNTADLAGVKGSGAGGRITIDDFERYLDFIEKQKKTKASSMRVAVADAMRRSWKRPLATVGLYASLDKILEHRQKLSPKPGPSLYALRALAIALSENSTPLGDLSEK
jgi:pyruvate/2-oxoglutarate dehydrogenase complex dihydrolipoamide acyltransferase (E2) component